MAEFKSDTYTQQETAAGNAAKMIGSAELVSGKSAFLQCKVTIPAGTAASDTILLGYIPSGMTIIPGLVTYTVQSSAGANPINVGVAGSPNVISESASLNTTGVISNKSLVGSYKNTERQPLIATLSGALTAGSVFYINIPMVNSN